MIKRLQKEHRAWMDHNFPDRKLWMQLAGLMEELGELAHAHLKGAQGIRDGGALRKDAIGDIFIFLMGYCSDHGIDLEDCITETWEKVKQRDWQADKKNGVAV